MEYFDLVDINNQPIGTTATRDECHSNPDLIHRVVHVIVTNHEGNIYLKKRSMNKDLYPGLWEDSTAGHIDSGETREQAAYRELKEELGIEGVVLKYITDFKSFSEVEREWSRLYCCQYDGLITLDNEATEGRFFSVEEVEKILEKETLPIAEFSRIALEEFFKHQYL